jgi:hypothetical protein
MSPAISQTRLSRSRARTHHWWRERGIVSIAAATFLALVIGGPVAATSTSPTTNAGTARLSRSFPIGTPDSSEPSGEAPPGPQALPGYALSYVNDFNGSSLPPGWDSYSGVPGGDPGGRFAQSHVVVSGGLLQLNTYQDPAYDNRWIVGGLCQCGLSKKYGAYFVRSRITGAGPSEIQLLWPAANVWPPEVDFNETGGSATSTTSSLHYGSANIIVRRRVNVNMTNWHTWGVIWTANRMVYTVDGRIWGEVVGAAMMPSIPMRLVFQQQQQCEEGRQCPTAPESMLVDWVAEYTQR